MKKYNKKLETSTTVTASRLHTDNYKDVLAALVEEANKDKFAIFGYSFNFNKSYIMFNFKYNRELVQNVLRVGDFLVKNGNKLEVWDPVAFLDAYEVVTEEETKPEDPPEPIVEEPEEEEPEEETP